MLLLWHSVTIDKLDRAGITALYSDAARCASILPAVKLMLAILQAQSSSNPASTSRTNTDGGNEPWAQTRAVLATTLEVAQVLTAGSHMRSKPGAMQLLTAPEVPQLLLITAAWLTGLLHQQKQGRAAVHTSSVVRSLSNSSAAAAYPRNSRGSSSSSAEVPPHHIQVLEMLGAPAADPGKHSSPASSQNARTLCTAIQQDLDFLLAATLTAAWDCIHIASPASCLAASMGGPGTVPEGAASGQHTSPGSVPGSSSSSSSSGSSSGSSSSWGQLLLALARMLVGVLQLGPCSHARQAAMSLMMWITRQDMGVWQQPAGAAVVGEMVMQLGPAVLHAVQQQQSQEDAENCQFALWYWAVAVMNSVGTGGWFERW
jgi:hypothetical protein